MGFEIVTPGAFRTDGLTPGNAAIHKNGAICFVNSDLINRGITASTEVVMMVDKLTNRIALRKAREGEPGRKPKLGKTKKIAEFRISAAFRELGKKCKQVNKRYPVSVKDDMLIIQL